MQWCNDLSGSFPKIQNFSSIKPKIHTCRLTSPTTLTHLFFHILLAPILGVLLSLFSSLLPQTNSNWNLSLSIFDFSFSTCRHCTNDKVPPQSSGTTGTWITSKSLTDTASPSTMSLAQPFSVPSRLLVNTAKSTKPAFKKLKPRYCYAQYPWQPLSLDPTTRVRMHQSHLKEQTRPSEITPHTTTGRLSD